MTYHLFMGIITVALVCAMATCAYLAVREAFRSQGPVLPYSKEEIEAIKRTAGKT